MRKQYSGGVETLMYHGVINSIGKYKTVEMKCKHLKGFTVLKLVIIILVIDPKKLIAFAYTSHL